MVKDIVIGGIAGILLGLTAFLGLGGGSKSEAPNPASPIQVNIEDICRKTQTKIALVSTENGPQFQAKYEDVKVRYDLTWQPAGTVVAVEVLKGTEYTAGTAQITPAFEQCVEEKGYQIIPRGQ